MAASTSRSVLALTLVLVLAGCGPTTAAPGALGRGEQPVTGSPPTPKRLTAAVMSEPRTLTQKLNINSLQAGIDGLEEMLSAGAGLPDDRGMLRPQLAEAVPSIENGLWRVFPDGRMETVWTIRSTAAWHDRTPVTSEDLLFTLRVGQDRELAHFRDGVLDLIDSIDAPDARTVVVRWSKSYIYADNLFTRLLALPLPRHLLEAPYREDKAGFIQLPYWAEEFVGAGPYKLREWVRGSHLVLQANDQYVLGRPKIDELEVKFIPEHATLMANILAGTVEVTIGRNLSLEQSLQVQEQWKDGKPIIGIGNWIVIFPQLLTPNPLVVANVQLRRALMHAIDRQQMVDTIQAGMTSVADSFLSPDQPEYPEVASSVVRYEYDARKAATLLEGLGYTRGPDGFRDAGNQRLALEFRTVDNNQIHMPALLSVTDYWRRLGIAVEPVAIPQQRANEREYRATFPGFELLQNPNDLKGLIRYTSSRSPLPENNYQVVGNYSRYMNPELDALIDSYYVTIPRAERTRLVGRIVHHTTDQVTLLGMFYIAVPAMVSNRVVNITTRTTASPGAWNSHEWDVRS
jgi:peptide/nickel transport system substrate-binding protein